MAELASEPEIRDWMVQKEIDFRRNAVGFLQKASKAGILPSPVMDFGIFPTGEASVVFKINAKDHPYVVKMTRTPGIVEAEAGFFDTGKNKV